MNEHFAMQTNSNTDPGDGSTIAVDVPARNSDLFRSQAVHEVLSFLSRYYAEEFSITELGEAVDYSQPSVSKAVDVLAANDLVVERREGTARNVRINRGRLSRPDDPFLRIPQPEFQLPVRAAVDELVDRLDDVVAIVLYGSVARGEADRRSDVDLWVLVRDGRAESRRTVNEIERDLAEREFEGGRYDFDIDVEAVSSVPRYTDDVRDIVLSGIPVYETAEFETVENLLRNEVDEDE